ncbi:MAG: hypothetical protein ACRETO_11700 [Gammaproteobacteria bacterium]
MKFQLRHSMPILATIVCTACASVPELTPTQLSARQLAAVYVASAAAWKISAPPGQGYRIDITHVNGHQVCTPSRCPNRVTLPAGHAEIELLCSMLIANLQLPKQHVYYTSDFLAGHVYRIRPGSVVPNCKVQVQDVTALAS